MAKRVNPHRRLLAKQAQALAAARLVQSAVQGAEMARLQQGPVRSSFASVKSKAVVRLTRDGKIVETMREPHWSNIDVPGKAKRKRPSRWSKTK